jgi:hypothetical protein
VTPARAIASLSGLWALAVSQPILDVLARAPEFFIAHRADTIDAVLLAAGLGLVGPLAGGVLILLARFANTRSMGIVAATCLGALAGMIAVQAGYRAGATGWIATAVSFVAGAALVGIAWFRIARVRTFLLVLSPATLVVPLVFLLSGPFRATDGAGASATTSARATPVVVVVFDELSLVSLMDANGRINPDRYPQISALAADGVWFRNATAVSDYTRFALPAILTGRYPVAGSTPTSRDHPDTLFTLLARTHRTETFEPITAICPRALCTGSETPRMDRLRGIAADVEVVAAHIFLPPDARTGLPNLTENWAGFDAEAGDDADETADDEDAADTGPRTIRATRNWRRVWRGAAGMDHLETASAFIAGISGDDRQPTFYFMHTLVSHHPSRWLPSGQRIANRRSMPGVRDRLWPDDPWLVDQHHHGHLVQAGLVDTLVGRMVDRLKTAGLYDNALIVMTADHGASFRAGTTMRAFSGDNAAEIAAVPLIVKLPAGTAGPPPGTIDDRNAETIDILPTVAAVLGGGLGWAVDGASLVGPPVERPEKRVFFNLGTMDARLKPHEVAARRDEAVRRQSARFGDGAWPVFTLEPFVTLIGRDVSAFGTIEEATDIQVLLDRNGLSDVDLNAAELPAQVSGRVRLPKGMTLGRAPLAVALNGTIVATTRAWSPTARWVAMLPPSALRAGRNEIDVFVIDPERADRLRRPAR